MIGKSELSQILTKMGEYRRIEILSINLCRFTEELFNSVSFIFIHLESSKIVPSILLDFDIVSANIHSLLVLDVIDRE